MKTEESTMDKKAKNIENLIAKYGEKKVMSRAFRPLMINPFDGEDLLLDIGYCPYIDIDTLLLIKGKLEKSIEFASKNDVKELNNNAVRDYQDSINRKDRPSQKPAKKITKIYLMVDYNTGLHKIGRSKRPLKREATLQSEKPTINLIAFWEDGEDIEQMLHEKYSNKRIRGEWFDLSGDDLNEILSNDKVIFP